MVDGNGSVVVVEPAEERVVDVVAPRFVVDVVSPPPVQATATIATAAIIEMALKGSRITPGG
jgi:hypothetical protein